LGWELPVSEFRTEFDEFDVLLTDAASENLRKAVHQRIRDYNDSRSEHHRMARTTGVKKLDIFVHDGEGRLRGGLVASTYWGWLEVEDLWLDEGLRGQGYGRRLVAMAEEEARARGCQWSWLRTFGFQARGFYERLGYRVVGVLEDYPPGDALYWLRKDLEREEGG
jgi:ribosomal protein S18 acetylase RimI-like enzyme